VKRVLAAGLNPAWQRTLSFESFAPGAVNRASASSEGAAGKGVNFARASKIWGKAQATVLQFAGGRSGELLLEAMAKEGLSEISRSTQALTRVCTTVLSKTWPQMTELIEPSAEVGSQDAEALLDAALKALPGMDALAICGSYPPGAGEAFYERLALAAKEAGKPVLMDSFMGVERALASKAVSVLKINLEEFRKLSGGDEIKASMRGALERHSLDALALTDGPGTARLACAEGLWSYEIPRLQELVNPLGAGDCCAAVMLSEILEGSAAGDAFVSGLAAASASCLSKACAVFEPAKAMEIRAATHANFEPWV